MQVGDKVRFTPNAFTGESCPIPEKGKKLPPPREVTGTIFTINEAHRHYTVAYEVNGYHLTESFKF